MSYAWEWADAEREYQRAIELNPNLALAHRSYATYLRLMGRHEQAISAITRARELDPLSPGVNATVGYVLSSARRYDQAIDALNKTIELDPQLSLYASVSRAHVCRSGQARGGGRGVHASHCARSRHPCHTGLSWRRGRAGGRPRARAGDPSAPAIEQGARFRSRTGAPADGAGRAGAGVRVARRRLSRAGHPAAIPWRRAGVRSAALGPAVRGSDATGRAHAVTHSSATSFLGPTRAARRARPRSDSPSPVGRSGRRARQTPS